MREYSNGRDEESTDLNSVQETELWCRYNFIQELAGIRGADKRIRFSKAHLVLMLKRYGTQDSAKEFIEAK